MNKHLIALAVAAATLSGAASAAQVYSDDSSSLAIGGRVEVNASSEQVDNKMYQLNHKQLDNEVTDISRVRVNIDAKTQIADGVQGIGFFEREFKSNNGDDENRYMYAGV